VERAKIRALILEYLASHPCVDCGEADPLLLDFDHRLRTEKRDAVSRLALSGSWGAVVREIQKCDVRCANCHRRRTAEQLRWRKDPQRGTLDVSTISKLGPVLTRPSATGRPVIEQLSIWSVGKDRLCYACRERKPAHAFAFRNRKTGERHGYCRGCQARYRRDHYRRNKATYVTRAQAQMRQRREVQVRLLHDYLRTHPCVDCGEAEVALLEFDHVDGSPKETEVSNMLGRRSWAKLLAEIGKCDVRCANCHRKRTAKQFGWKNGPGEESCGSR
jgi:hypothetical protein